MSATHFIPEQLFVHDETEISDSKRIGTFNIRNRDALGEDTKWIANVMPYGGVSFPDYEEAKAYAKLFVASPDMITELRENHEFLLQVYSKMLQREKIDIDEMSQNLRDRMAKQLAIINKATT